MAYARIDDERQLPAVGPVPEHLRFDMKMEVAQALLATPDPVSMASDIAAFANAQGGVLLIGAKEEPRGLLAEYVPVSLEQATKVVEKYQDALRLCSPRPVIDAKPLPKEGGFVVVVNCDLYAAPPVGVMQANQNKAEPVWWAYPVRRGNRTHNLRPEELATIMEPKLRRMFHLLRSIPANGPHGHRWITAHSGGGGNAHGYIPRIDEIASTFTLGFQAGLEIQIPIDAVRFVWADAIQRHHVAIEGTLDETGVGGYTFHPG